MHKNARHFFVSSVMLYGLRKQNIKNWKAESKSPSRTHFSRRTSDKQINFRNCATWLTLYSTPYWNYVPQKRKMRDFYRLKTTVSLTTYLFTSTKTNQSKRFMYNTFATTMRERLCATVLASRVCLWNLWNNIKVCTCHRFCYFHISTSSRLLELEDNHLSRSERENRKCSFMVRL